MKFIFPERTRKSDMIKLILEITRIKTKRNLKENNEKLEGKTHGIFYSGIIPKKTKI